MDRSRLEHFKFILLLTLSFNCVISCAQRDASPTEASTPPPRVILFLPGYKGSELREAKSESLVWVSIVKSLWENHSLKISDEQSTPTLKASAVLLDLPILGSLFRRNIYGEWVSHLRHLESPTTKVLLFPYDWRQDNLETVKELSRTIDHLIETGTKTIDVVAHSMGALALAYYLRYGTSEGIEDWSGAKKIRHAVLVNTPFRGTVKLVRDFRRGDFPISAATIRSFPACFEMLPSEDSMSILDEQEKPMDVNFFNIETWHKYSWGPFGIDGSEKEINGFANRLKKGENFVEYLNAPDLYPNRDQDQSTKLLNVQSNGFLTQTKCYALPKYKHRIACNEDDLEDAGSALNPDLLYEDGDGTIGVQASALPEAFKDSLHTESRVFKGDHLTVLEDAKVRESVFLFLNQGTAP